MATDVDAPRSTGWSMAGHLWQPNRRLTENQIYEIGGVGMPPFEMFVHCLPQGTVIPVDDADEEPNRPPATDRD
eukprot:6508218-Heterocapsa_arctica.AAC.1